MEETQAMKTESAKKIDKQGAVLSLADEAKLAAVLINLGFFRDIQLTFECPAKDYYSRCGKKQDHLKICAWNWKNVGSNPDCPLDAEIKPVLDSIRAVPLEQTISKSLMFKLQDIHGGHTVDITIGLPHEVDIHPCFKARLNPNDFFIVFDLELKDILRAIRFVRLISAAYPKSGAQPIIMTYADAPVEILEKQGIKVYRLKGESS